jgi:autotransporter-associated beta strand protein
VEIFGTGTISTSSNPFFFGTEVTVGSIEGNGTIELGDSTLVPGSNNRRTIFDGIIKDGHATEGFGGSLVKSGEEGLTLAHANNYTRSTVVMSGVLRVANRKGSATGNGFVHVAGGTLGGPGRIGGPVRIGTGNGPGAFLAPSIHANEPTTLTIHRAPLSFQRDGTYTYKLNTRNATADQVIATGVTIESGTQFSFTSVDNKRLTPGTVFTAISNTSADPISGTFANLPDGGIVTVNGNNFQASYTGGDGNDLTLTVVP